MHQLRVPEYFWYDPFNPEDWAGFVLSKGVYEPLSLDAQGRFKSSQLGLALVRWQGFYKDVEAVWLRWTTLEGVLLPTDREVADLERQRADQAERRAEQLAAQLRAMGINPEEI